MFEKLTIWLLFRLYFKTKCLYVWKYRKNEAEGGRTRRFDFAFPSSEKVSESGEILRDKYENESRLYLADVCEAPEGGEGGGEEGEGGGGGDAQASTRWKVEERILLGIKNKIFA